MSLFLLLWALYQPYRYDFYTVDVWRSKAFVFDFCCSMPEYWNTERWSLTRHGTNFPEYSSSYIQLFESHWKEKF